jgi:hypothetical protein
MILLFFALLDAFQTCAVAVGKLQHCMEASSGSHCFNIAACGVALENMAHTA